MEHLLSSLKTWGPLVVVLLLFPVGVTSPQSLLPPNDTAKQENAPSLSHPFPLSPLPRGEGRGGGEWGEGFRPEFPEQAAHSNPSDRGTFELFTAGKSVGTEKFEIRGGRQQVEAQAEIHLRLEHGGKLLELKTTPSLVLDPQLRPLSYSWSQKGSQSSSLSIDFRSSPAHTNYKNVRGEDEKRDFKLPKDVVVLDDNVLHHYQLLLDRYDPATHGKQTFQAFVPQEAMPGAVTVEEAGTEPISVEGATLNLRHFVLTTELAQVDLWVDAQTHLQVVSVPAAQFQAIRKK